MEIITDVVVYAYKRPEKYRLTPKGKFEGGSYFSEARGVSLVESSPQGNENLTC